MTALSELTGLLFTRWTVVHRAENNARGRAQWFCRCECGTERVVLGSHLASGRSRSCGCLSADSASKRASQRNAKHGHTTRGYSSPEYVSWCSMLNRCKHPCVNGYEYYGGRGITVCERWRDFRNFLSDMGLKPSPKHTIDRIDPNGHYTPDNCRWSTPKEQRHNQRRVAS